MNDLHRSESSRVRPVPVDSLPPASATLIRVVALTHPVG